MLIFISMKETAKSKYSWNCPHQQIILWIILKKYIFYNYKMGICCNLMYDYLLVWILWHASICAFLWSCAEMYRNCHYMYFAAGISFYLISSYLTTVLYVIFYCRQSCTKVSLFFVEARTSAGQTFEGVKVFIVD